MAIEDLRVIGNVLYERRADGILYPVRRVRPDTEARGVPAQEPSLLNVGGIGERLAFLNQTFNPVEAIGQSMTAGERLFAQDADYLQRLAALGDMLSGVAGVTGPAVVAGRAGVPAATAVMESLLGGSPTTQAAGDMGRQFVADESGALRLYHGSPHDFAAERLVRYPDGRTEYIVGRPDVLPDVPAGAEVLRDFPLGRQRMDKIGTGEGVQVYGRGLYNAEAEDVARGYRDRLSQNKVAMIGNNPVMSVYKNLESQANKLPFEDRQEIYDKMAFLEDLEYFSDFNHALSMIENAATRDWAINEIAPNFKPAGHMYEVNINANPEDFLDWDKPLSEQPAKVQDVFREFGQKSYSDALADYDDALLSVLFDDAIAPLPNPPLNPTGAELYMRSGLKRYAVKDDAGGKWGPGASSYDESLALAGGDPKRVRTIVSHTPAERSEALRRAGIPGIRYFDQGSRGAGDGTRNYVVFDENLIEIVRKYGIAGAATMLGVTEGDVAQAIEQNLPPSEWERVLIGPQ